MGILRKQSSYGYTRLDEWDPEERRHREAQFLIYKTLQKVEEIARPSKSSWLIPLRFCKLKVKVGRRLKRLRRGVTLNLFRARAGLSKQLSALLKACRRWRLHGGAAHSAAPLL